MAFFLAPSAFASIDGWTAPTPEELSMTSIPQVPGAPAVILFKEELADDAMHSQTFYMRVKVLTEGGKEYATVELPYYTGVVGREITNIDGRTIHPDGTIVPFTGKPYDKVVSKGVQSNGTGYEAKVKVFSLPSVEIGSIVEYRYKVTTDDRYFTQPEWIVQSDLFTRKAHFMWKPTDRQLMTPDGKLTDTGVAWTPILPPGVKVEVTDLPQTGLNRDMMRDSGHTKLDLTVTDIAPIPKEQFMPPMQSLRYRVMFYYATFRTAKEYWAQKGKQWSKAEDKFIGHSPAVAAKVAELTSASDTPEEKLRKLYGAVMQLENTGFTRSRSASEDKAQGLKEVDSADDILKLGRGNGDQLALLFIAMARAAGLKAYAMEVADRSERIFLAEYFSASQLNGTVAIVNVDGKEMYFDPGQRYCPFGHLSWKHAFTGGLRQTEGGTELASTPAAPYQETVVKRTADLTLDDHGVASGTLTIESTGDAALASRQAWLRGDPKSFNTGLKAQMERQLPRGLEVDVDSIENIDDPEQPLKIGYIVKGTIASSTGKRLLVPADLFEKNAQPKFPEPKREQPIDLRYASRTQDAIRLKLPPTLAVESAPAAATAQIPATAAFETRVKSDPASITLYRNVTVGKFLFGTEKYGDLRSFYNQLEAKDQETVVLTHANPGTSGGER